MSGMVLVVDDEPSIRTLLADVLEELGFRSIEASDAATALKVLEATSGIGLMVTDLGLRGEMDGRALADTGRALRPSLKILFITGYEENAAEAKAALGPDMRVLTKPFVTDDLMRVIRELIGP